MNQSQSILRPKTSSSLLSKPAHSSSKPVTLQLQRGKYSQTSNSQARSSLRPTAVPFVPGSSPDAHRKSLGSNPNDLGSKRGFS
jgi:hypothetical protein